MASSAWWMSTDQSDSSGSVRDEDGWISALAIDSDKVPFEKVPPSRFGSSSHWKNANTGFSFYFTGRAVKIYGSSSSSQISWECFVDGKRLDSPTQTKTTSAEGSRDRLCDWMGAGAASAHVLTVKVGRVPPGQRFWVKQIQYLALSGSASTDLDSEPSSPSNAFMDYKAEAPLLLSLEPRDTASGEKVPPALIAAGVLGGIAVVGALVIAYWLRKRQKRHEVALDLKERGILIGLRGSEA